MGVNVISAYQRANGQDDILHLSLMKAQLALIQRGGCFSSLSPPPTFLFLI